MDRKIAVVSMILHNKNSVATLNSLLHDYSKYIIGRMGIPYHALDINIISIAMDAPADIINALSGKIGILDGVSVKTVYSDVATDKTE